MKVALNYGRKEILLDLDPQWDVTVIKKIEMPSLGDPSFDARMALSQGINANSLSQEASECKSACILICDITRPVPNGLILPPILRTLLSSGIKKENILILIATGLHRPNEGMELEELVEDSWVLDNFRIENHFAEDNTAHVDLGLTAKGTPVKLDRRFVDSDLKLVTGLVEPHFMAGFSGGRKVVAPGIAHKDTIKTFHNYRFMSDHSAKSCVLDHNPLHLEQLEIIKKIGRVLAVNTVIDEERKLAFINYGEIVESHLNAVDFVRKYIVKEVCKKFGTVVTSAAGYPLDQTYYQTVKGIVGPSDIIVDGGDVVVVSSCTEGLGSAHFARAQDKLIKLGEKAFLTGLAKKKFADIDEWQTQMQIKATSKFNVHLFTEGLNKKEKRLTGINVIDSVEETIRDLMIKKDDKSLAIIPEGPYVVPKYVSS